MRGTSRTILGAVAAAATVSPSSAGTINISRQQVSYGPEVSPCPLTVVESDEESARSQRSRSVRTSLGPLWNLKRQISSNRCVDDPCRLTNFSLLPYTRTKSSTRHPRADFTRSGVIPPKGPVIGCAEHSGMLTP